MCRILRVTWASSVVIAIWLGFQASCQAQIVLTDATSKKLETVLHIPSSTVTLDAVALQIEKQSGVPIHPAAYLLTHKLILKVNGLTALALLNAVSELYGWQWREIQDGSVVIDRPTTRTPEVWTAVSKQVGKALSPQLLRYLGYKSEETALDQSQPFPLSAISKRFPQQTAPDDRSEHIWPSLPEALRVKAQLPITKLSEDDRERVLESLVGRAFRTSYTCLIDLAHQNFLPFIRDPLSVTVSYQYSQDGRLQGFQLLKKWTDPNGVGHHTSGIICSIQFMQNDQSANAIRMEAIAAGDIDP